MSTAPELLAHTVAAGDGARHAAVFLLARSATVDRVVDALKPFSPTIIQTNLTKEREEELVEALQS